MRLSLIGRLVTLVLALLVAPCAAAAPAPTHVPRIGVLSQFAPPAQPSAAFEGFRAGLRELGYTEGRNVALEYRYAEGQYERLAPLAAALVRLPVDVMVALSPPALQAAVQATATLPIVGIGVPTGAAANVTGVDTGAEAFHRTWHALLMEALTGASRVALLWDETLGSPRQHIVYLSAHGSRPYPAARTPDRDYDIIRSDRQSLSAGEMARTMAQSPYQGTCP